jgi:hypothetical protein
MLGRGVAMLERVATHLGGKARQCRLMGIFVGGGGYVLWTREGARRPASGADISLCTGQGSGARRRRRVVTGTGELGEPEEMAAWRMDRVGVKDGGGWRVAPAEEIVRPVRSGRDQGVRQAGHKKGLKMQERREQERRGSRLTRSGAGVCTM